MIGTEIICRECDGNGEIESDGRLLPCPVCDGGKTITFEDHKEYARQIDKLHGKLRAYKNLAEVTRRLAMAARDIGAVGEDDEVCDFEFTRHVTEAEFLLSKIEKSEAL